MAQYTGSTAWAYNDLVSAVRRGTTSGAVGDALEVFNANWISDKDGDANLYLLEAYRGVVPFGVILARIAWDNPELYVNRRGIIGGRAAGGLAMQRVQDYRTFDLHPPFAAGSIALLVYRLREIAERRLAQYSQVWNAAIFGNCPADPRTEALIWMSGADQTLNRILQTYPRVTDQGGSRSWAQVERNVSGAGYQYVAELGERPERFAELVCGMPKPPFWPSVLARTKDFWTLVLLEERTSTEVGDKIWSAILKPFGEKGEKLPPLVLALLYKKGRLYAPRLDVHLMSLLANKPQELSVSNFDIATLQAEARNAASIASGAGYVATPQNKVAWMPDQSQGGLLKLEPGSIRKLRLQPPIGSPKIYTTGNFPLWNSDSEDWAALSTGANRVSAPRATGASGPLAVPGEPNIPAPRKPVTMATWKKLAVALSVGTACILGAVYVINRRK